MATEVVLPMLGITIEKGKVLKWLKSEGDRVQKGEPLFEVEADKVTTEVESSASGILKKIYVAEDVEVPVLSVLAVITAEGEALGEKEPGGEQRAAKPDIAELSGYAVTPSSVDGLREMASGRIRAVPAARGTRGRWICASPRRGGGAPRNYGLSHSVRTCRAPLCRSPAARRR